MSGQDASHQESATEVIDSDEAYDSMRKQWKQIKKELEEIQKLVDQKKAEAKDYKKMVDLEGELKTLEDDWDNGTSWEPEELRME